MAERIDVFISSTSRDLEAYRQAVTNIIIRLGMYPIGMEGFNPTGNNALQLCYDKVQEAEVFIGIYAHRYGYAPGDDVTYTTVEGATLAGDGETGITHLEYQWAIERDLPMLLFVVEDDTPWNPNDIEDEPGKSRLKAFKDMILGKHVVGFFSSPDNLASQVATGLAEIKSQLEPEADKPFGLPRRRDFYKHVQLPPNYVSRQELIEELRLALLGEEDEEAKGTIAFHGMGGIGKSVMARALCEDPAVQAAFPDGILWTSLGQTPNLTAKLREWVEALGGTVGENAPTVDSLKATLAELLENRTCLLVLDDVWQKKHAEAFRVVTENSRLLMTTRDAEIPRGMGADVHPIPSMSLPEAIHMLDEWADGNLTDADDATQKTIVVKLGRLPLAIKLAGAQLQKKSPDKWLERFDARKLKSKRAETVHDSLEQTFGLSLETLDETERKLYAALAIFREDEPIHEVAIARLWDALDEFDEDDTEELLDDLAARALLEVAGDEYPRAAVLHDLLRDYMGAELEDPKSYHQALLDAYAETQAGDGWHTASDDGYLYDHLVYHLTQSHAFADAVKLFQDQGWMIARFNTNNYTYDGYVIDIKLATQHLFLPTLRQQVANQHLQTAFAAIFRCLLIKSSISAISNNYSAPLVSRAVELGVWSIARALSVVKDWNKTIKLLHVIHPIATHPNITNSQRETLSQFVVETIADLAKTSEASHQADKDTGFSSFRFTRESVTLVRQIMGVLSPANQQQVIDIIEQVATFREMMWILPFLEDQYQQEIRSRAFEEWMKATHFANISKFEFWLDEFQEGNHTKAKAHWDNLGANINKSMGHDAGSPLTRFKNKTREDEQHPSPDIDERRRLANQIFEVAPDDITEQMQNDLWWVIVHEPETLTDSQLEHLIANPRGYLKWRFFHHDKVTTNNLDDYFAPYLSPALLEFALQNRRKYFLKEQAYVVRRVMPIAQATLRHYDGETQESMEWQEAFQRLAKNLEYEPIEALWHIGIEINLSATPKHDILKIINATMALENIAMRRRLIVATAAFPHINDPINHQDLATDLLEKINQAVDTKDDFVRARLIARIFPHLPTNLQSQVRAKLLPDTAYPGQNIINKIMAGISQDIINLAVHFIENERLQQEQLLSLFEVLDPMYFQAIMSREVYAACAQSTIDIIQDWEWL